MKQAFSLRIPIELYERLKAEANKKGIPAHSLILNVLWDYFKN